MFTVDDHPDTLPYRDKVQEWAERHLTHPCAVCWQENWTVEGRVFFLQRLMPNESGEIINVTGMGRVLFLVTCETCGNTLTINALKTGLIE